MRNAGPSGGARAGSVQDVAAAVTVPAALGGAVAAEAHTPHEDPMLYPHCNMVVDVP